MPGSPRSLRGLAHPLRLRILRILREQGASTATRLAGQTGESSGATSYHLRQLAGYGFVEEEPRPGPGRERWWRVSSLGRGDSVTIGNRTVRLTPAQAAELLGRIDRMLADYPDEPASADTGRVVFQWQYFPQIR